MMRNGLTLPCQAPVHFSLSHTIPTHSTCTPYNDAHTALAHLIMMPRAINAQFPVYFLNISHSQRAPSVCRQHAQFALGAQRMLVSALSTRQQHSNIHTSTFYGQTRQHSIVLSATLDTRWKCGSMLSCALHSHTKGSDSNVLTHHRPAHNVLDQKLSWKPVPVENAMIHRKDRIREHPFLCLPNTSSVSCVALPIKNKGLCSGVPRTKA